MSNYNLNRFIKAQNDVYEITYLELLNGKKESDWMPYMFPRIFGLSMNETSIYYSINSIDEAKAYLENEILKERLMTLLNVLLNLETNDSVKIFGFPENLEFWSSITLFSQIAPEEVLFQKILEKYFQGRLELATVDIVKEQRGKI